MPVPIQYMVEDIIVDLVSLQHRVMDMYDGMDTAEHGLFPTINVLLLDCNRLMVEAEAKLTELHGHCTIVRKD